MKAFDADPELRWLFCMTHPDDEISICAWIRRLAMQGNAVHLCWTHSIPVREAEARAVGLLLGVPQGCLHFVGGTDGRVPEEMPRLLPRLRAIIDSVAPHRIACGAFEQGHLDHDATNLLVSRCFDGPICEIPFYHTYLTRFQRLNRFAKSAGEELMALEPDEQRMKTAIARQFPSQNIWSVLLWYEMWHKTWRRPMELTRAERMRIQPKLDYRKPNLPSRLASRVEKSPSWARWLRAVDALDRVASEASV